MIKLSNSCWHVMDRWCLFPTVTVSIRTMCVWSAHHRVRGCAFWGRLFLTSCCRFPLCVWWWLHGPAPGLRVQGHRCWTVGAQRRLNLERILYINKSLFNYADQRKITDESPLMEKLPIQNIFKDTESTIPSPSVSNGAPSSAFVPLSPWTGIIYALPGIGYNTPAATHIGSGEKRAEPLIYHKYATDNSTLRWIQTFLIWLIFQF